MRTYEVLWNCVSLKLRLDAQSLHKLPHAISSEVDKHQSVAVCVCGAVAERHVSGKRYNKQ